MGKRASWWLMLCLAMAACLCDAGCTGTPALFHAVTLVPKGQIVIGSGGSQILTASVLNDTSGAGVNWGTPAHGTLTAITTTSATYNAPLIAPGGSVPDTVTATSITFPNNSASLSITIQGAPVISTTSLPAGNQGTPYSSSVSAAGGVGPFAWSISAGSLPPGLSLGASTTNSVTISGTPTAQGTFNFTIQITDSSGAAGTQALSIAIGAPLPLKVATTTLPNGVLNLAYPATTLEASGGVPPFAWTVTLGALPAGLMLASDGTITGTPTVSGTFNFTVQVADSETPAKTATGNLSITVNNLGPLQGNYAFLFSGFDAKGAVAIAGSFTADGVGNITNGVEDFNSTVAGSYKNQVFTGTYTLGSDNRGVLTLSSLPGPPAFAFAVDGTGTHGRMIEFDASGVRGSGQIEKRTVSACASTTLTGQYAFGVSGQVISSSLSSAGPAVIVGSFLATPPSGSGSGSISNSENDANTPGGVVRQNQGWGGSFQTTPQNSRCSMNLLPSVAPSGLTYSVYPVSANEAFLVEIDQVSSTQPFLTSGKLLRQVGFPFSGGTGSAFTGVSIAGLVGQLLKSSTYVPDLALVALTGSSSASFSLSIVENVAGTVSTNPLSGTFSSSDQFGRLDSSISTPIDPVFYLVSNNEAFCIGEIVSNPFFGIFEPQAAAPFSASALNGDFVLGTSSPATSSVPNSSGTVTLANTSTTAGTLNGTQDQSTSSANTAGQMVTGTYSGLSSSTGAGNLALTAPTSFSGDFLLVSPTKIVILSTTASDPNPVLIYLGECTTTCGED